MLRKLLPFLLFWAIGFGFSQRVPPGGDRRLLLQAYLKLDQLYEAAEAISLQPDYTAAAEEKESRMNREALDGFTRLLPLVSQQKEDSLAFFVWLKMGTLLHYFDSLSPAQEAYRKAIAIKARVPQLADSVLFKPLLYSGGIYYNLNQFDSALANYQRAEKLAAAYPIPLSGSNRLFNTLGAMYYETGNFTQAQNYFEKAIAVLPPSESFYEDLLANYKVNLASTLNKLERYEEAEKIYAELLPLRRNESEILHNLGAIRSARGDYAAAIRFFNKVQYTNNKTVRLCNDLADAWLQLHQYDSAQVWIDQARTENRKWYGEKKNSPFGLTLRFAGDVLLAKGRIDEAVAAYQQAIMQFDRNFGNPDPSANPEHFELVFSYIPLFHTLVAKAGALEIRYEKKQDQSLLESALKAYRSAFDLADYVEKTYDSDEARLFLNRIKYTVHGKPIDLSLRLYELSKEPRFLEQAYLYDQQNKASILSLNVRENEIRSGFGHNNRMLQQEAAIKSAITRLSLRAPQTTDSSGLASLQSSIRDYKIRLGKLQDSINEDPSFRQQRNIERIPGVAELQQLLDTKTALISYHLAPGELVILVMTKEHFGYARVKTDSAFYEAIDSLKLALAQTSGVSRYTGNAAASRLYTSLIGPIVQQISNSRRLIIIPDDELNYLPFEALPDPEQHYLVEKFAVQYQYSTSLLASRQTGTKNRAGTLAFAPFASTARIDSAENLAPLPASAEEVAGLEGQVLKDARATREQFLSAANHYAVLHLATHASVNNEEPQRSYIAFYPGSKPDKLFAGEIYDLRLDSTQLVLLTACETGTGRLIHGEGLMSLSRAFTYAGCPNIITSLWKAEDKTTATIAQSLHRYLGKGYSRDEALQKAKLDLLQDERLDPRFKSPSAWAHLILIGEYEPVATSFNPWWLLLLLPVILVGVWIKKNPFRQSRKGNRFFKVNE